MTARVVPVEAEAPPGVTRFDVVCRPQVEDVEEVEGVVLELVDRWSEDRALRTDARARLVGVVRSAMGHGLQFEPRGLTVLIRWLDLDRVQVDLRWWRCSPTSSPGSSGQDLETTLATLDTLAAGWGVHRAGSRWVLWLVVDTG